MLAEIPLALLFEWMAYARAQPFGEKRADLRSGIVAATMANAFRGKGGKQFKPADFMPQFGKQRKQQSADEAEHVFRTHARLVGRHMERTGKRG